jgi:hypothetical protein
MEQGTPRRIGCLGAWADEPARDPAHAAWLSGLREKGWIEGKNLLVEYRCAPDRKPSMKEPAGNGRRVAPRAPSAMEICAQRKCVRATDADVCWLTKLRRMIGPSGAGICAKPGRSQSVIISVERY